jgi:hypothetical protein
MVDFMLGERGARLIQKYGYYSLTDLQASDVNFKSPE